MKKNMKISGILVLFLCITGVLFTSGSSGTGKDKSIKIGVFDSRAVAVAYAHSDFMKKKFEKMKKEKEKAEAEGNSKKVEQLEEQGKKMQKRLHQQGFGTASVSNLLEPVSSEIPKIAEKAGIDIIVSKWDIEYKQASVEVVDITDKIIESFNPDEKTLEKISALSKEPPISDEI